MIANDRVLDAFVEVADTLVDDFDLVEFLHTLTDHTAAISGIPSVGLLIGDEHEQLHYMAASTEGAQHLELFQLQNSEGPCLDCVRQREPVIARDLVAAEERWPAFAPRAIAAGFTGVHAFPMRLRGRVIGALNVFVEESQSLEDADARVIQALADVATIAILQERSIAAAETLTQQLQGALNSRIVIEQAKGVVAQSNGVSVDDAFMLLRSHSRSHHLRLTDVAREVVSGERDPRQLGKPKPG